MTRYWYDNQTFKCGKIVLIISTGNFKQKAVGKTMTVLYPRRKQWTISMDVIFQTLL